MNEKHPSLPPPDCHHLLAATGWLELGNFLEANEELEKITPELRVRPEVLHLRWLIYYQSGKHDAGLEIATSLVRLDPNNVQSWVALSISLYKTGNTQQAYETLKRKLSKFSAEWVVYYNLACYAVQLGNVGEAKRFLELAMVLGDEDQVKLRALDDPDLEPLWERIGET